MLDEKKDLEVSEETLEAVLNDAGEIQAEKDFIIATEGRLKTVFEEEKSLDMSPESDSEKDTSTPEDDKPAEEPDDGDGPTATEKKEEAKLEAEAKTGEEKTEPEVKAKDEDAGTKDDKKKDITPLSDAYVRAAIHAGWKEEDVNELYTNNPELALKTLGSIYEATNRSSKEFAAFGRKAKEQAKAPAEPVKTATEAITSEFIGVDIAKIKEQYPNDPITDMIQMMDDRERKQHERIQKLEETRSAPVMGQPSGSAAEIRANEQESNAIVQQIDAFFLSEDLKGYSDFYGTLPKNAINWDALTPAQKQNRWGAVEMMDEMILGARELGRKMEISEALNLSHLSVTEPIREKVIREKIKATATKRSKSISLEPSGTNQPADTGPKTQKDLEAVTADRLAKLTW